MKVVIGGNNWLAKQVSKWLLDNTDHLVGLVPECKDLAWEESFLEYSRSVSSQYKSLGVPCFEGNINKAEDKLKELAPELIVMCRSGALVKKPILDIPKLGVLNFHYAALPKYGGCSPIQQAILHGEEQIGVSLHLMAEAFDDGPIVMQRFIDISKPKRQFLYANQEKKFQTPFVVYGMTAFEAQMEANRVAFDMFKDVYFAFIKGLIKAVPQNKRFSSYYKAEDIDYKKDKYIDLDMLGNFEISRKVRAFTFPPVQFPIAVLKGVECGEIHLTTV